MSNAIRSTREIALSHEKRLAEWLRSVQLADIPRNQSGGACRTKILKCIGASRSTAQSNSRIAEFFQTLDQALTNTQAKDNQPPATDDNSDRTVIQILTGLRRENEHLSKEIVRLRWWEDTGRLPANT